MRPIAPSDALHPGDVLHHPAFGFATVEAADADGAHLRWERPSPTAPPRVSRQGLAEVWRACPRQGFFARSVTDPDGVRAWLGADPLAALGALLVDLGAPVEPADVRDWLVDRSLLTGRRFDGWWTGLLPSVERDPRFEWKGGSLRVRPGVDPQAFDAQRPSPLPAPGTLGAGAAFPFALRVARAVAEAHARGEVLVRDRAQVKVAGGEVRFATESGRWRHARREDVRFVMRLLLEQVLGALPDPNSLPDAELVCLVGDVSPALPPELLGVVQRSLAVDPDLRPADGSALLHALRLAEASATTRATAPFNPHAQVLAGFNSHIGILKSLQGQTNQDSFLLVGEPGLSLVGVADGISMSTAGTGDLAASLLVKTLRIHWQEHGEGLRDAGPGRVQSFLTDALRRANRVICEAASRAADGDLSRAIPMGTTALFGVTRGNRVHLASLGDSRAYLVSPGGVAPLTADQNLQALRLRDHFAAQAVTWDEPRFSLTGYLGYFGADGRPELPQPFTRTVTLLPGEWLVLCTDGFSDFAGSEDASTLEVVAASVAEARGTTPGALAMDVARRLVDAANRGGGGDNVTVLALTLSPEYAAAEDEG